MHFYWEEWKDSSYHDIFCWPADSLSWQHLKGWKRETGLESGFRVFDLWDMAILKGDWRDTERKRRKKERGNNVDTVGFCIARCCEFALCSKLLFCFFITSLIISTWIYEVQTLPSIYLQRFLIQNSLKHNLSLPHLYAVGRGWFLLSEAQRG